LHFGRELPFTGLDLIRGERSPGQDAGDQREESNAFCGSGFHFDLRGFPVERTTNAQSHSCPH